jgi:hypothetical protein
MVVVAEEDVPEFPMLILHPKVRGGGAKTKNGAGRSNDVEREESSGADGMKAALAEPSGADNVTDAKG